MNAGVVIALTAFGTMVLIALLIIVAVVAGVSGGVETRPDE